jgi:pimeloyl-ACP methyl ester carboxylesterase
MKRLMLYSTGLMLFMSHFAFADFPCFSPGNNQPPSNPLNGCPLAITVQAGNAVSISAYMGTFYPPLIDTYSGSVTGDLGSIVNDGTVTPPVTSLACPLGYQGLHFATKYSPGVHIVKATFSSCTYPYPQNATLMVTALPAGQAPPPTSCGPVALIDPLVPVPPLLSGNSVTTNRGLLAGAWAPVQGVAADGTAQTVIRVPVSNVNDMVSITVINDQGQVSSSPDDDGGVVGLGGDVSAVSSSVDAMASNAGLGPMAFAIYRAPTNFSRGTTQDDGAVQRSVTLQVKCQDSSGSSASSATVQIVRPPVILVHGVWSSASAAWQNFVPAKAAENALWSILPTNAVMAVNYNVPPGDVITETAPAYSPGELGLITRNALGFAYNAPFVLQQMSSYVGSFRQTFNVAAAQADVVAHSMGGDIARTMASLPSFQGSNTYGMGSIHKLITIGTPHQGTPLATQLLAPNNSCVVQTLPYAYMFSLGTVTFENTPPTSGAVADLQNGVSGSIPFPIAYIAGAALQSNFAGLDCTLCKAGMLRALCGGTVPGDPLANDLTSQNWSTVFASASSDALAPVSSQLNGTSNQLLVFPGVVHSQGIEQLDFGPPSELDSQSGIPDEVVDLLNELVNGTDFQH